MANTYLTLDISTANLSMHDWDVVEEAAACDGDDAASRESWMPRCVQHGYGAFINVPDRESFDDDEWEERQRNLAAHAPSLHALLEYARSLGCRWINVDRDADTDDTLPFYDW